MEEKKKRKYSIDFWIPVIMLTAMVFVVFISVIFRFAGHALSWPDEVCRWLLIWVTFTGACYGFKHGALVRVDLFIRLIFKKKAPLIDSIALVIASLFFGFLGVSGVGYCIDVISNKQVYPITRMPNWVIASGVVIGSVLVAFECLQAALKQIREYRANKGKEEKEQ